MFRTPKHISMKFSITTWFSTLLMGCLMPLLVAHNHKATSTPGKPPNPTPVRKQAQMKPGEMNKALKKSEDMKRHYENVANIDFDTMTDKEVTFHFFKLHDFDKNQMLDGLEIIKGLAHVMDSEEMGTYEQEEFEEMVDHMITKGDKNKDGYLTYTEYSISDIFDTNNPDGIHNF